jgi:hypothetical protein
VPQRQGFGKRQVDHSPGFAREIALFVPAVLTPRRTELHLAAERCRRGAEALQGPSAQVILPDHAEQQVLGPDRPVTPTIVVKLRPGWPGRRTPPLRGGGALP